MSITTTPRAASRPNSASDHQGNHVDPDRARFARSMVFATFRRRDAVALDFDGFVDRRSDQLPIFANGRMAP